MLAEMIDTISRTAVKAADLKHIRIDAKRSYLVAGDNITEIEYEPPPRQDLLYHLADIPRVIKEMGKCFVWISTDEIVIAKEPPALDTARIILERSEQFVALRDSKPMKQKAMVRALRLGQFGEVDDSVVVAISSLQFHRTEKGAGAVAHGRESLGRSVEAEVQGGAAEIPSRIQVVLPVYANPSFSFVRGMVTCEVFLDIERESIDLQPQAGELQRIVYESAANVRSRTHDIINDAGCKENCIVAEGRPVTLDIDAEFTRCH